MDATALDAMNCIFGSNRVAGPMFAWGAGAFDIRWGPARFVNCTFSYNNTQGLMVISGAATVVNCTFAYNQEQGLWCDSQSTLMNSILYYNGTPGGVQIGGIPPVVTYSDVQGGLAGEGNIDANPIFVSPTDLTLVPGSRCMDAGNPDPAYNDTCFPPSVGTARNDMGAYGGPGACCWLAPCDAPRIVMQPQSQTSCLGKSVTFSVTSSGFEPLSYQWWFKAAPLPGQRGANLTLVGLRPEDAGLYSVTVSNVVGSATSEPARLTVYDACVDIHMYAGLTISGQMGGTYVVSYTSNLENTNWTAVATNTLSGADWFFLDMESPFQPRRFYRVDLQP